MSDTVCAKLMNSTFMNLATNQGIMPPGCKSGGKKNIATQSTRTKETGLAVELETTLGQKRLKVPDHAACNKIVNKKTRILQRAPVGAQPEAVVLIPAVWNKIRTSLGAEP